LRLTAEEEVITQACGCGSMHEGFNNSLAPPESAAGNAKYCQPVGIVQMRGLNKVGDISSGSHTGDSGDGLPVASPEAHSAMAMEKDFAPELTDDIPMDVDGDNKDQIDLPGKKHDLEGGEQNATTAIRNGMKERVEDSENNGAIEAPMNGTQMIHNPATEGEKIVMETSKPVDSNEDFISSDTVEMILLSNRDSILGEVSSKQKEAEGAVVDLFRCRCKEKVLTALDTLILIVGNIIENPNEEKFKKVRLNNKKFQRSIGAISGGINFLIAIGFKDTGSETLLFSRNDPGLLWLGRSILAQVRELAE